MNRRRQKYIGWALIVAGIVLALLSVTSEQAWAGALGGVAAFVAGVAYVQAASIPGARR